LGRLAGTRHGPAAHGIDVVADDAPAGRDEALRECASHDAQTDDADFAFRHSKSPLPNRFGRYTGVGAAFKFNVRASMSDSRLSHMRIIPYRHLQLPKRHRRAGESP
jgi:hypothetical protein